MREKAMNLMNVDEEMTMTTADIAKIVDVRHDNVVRDVKAMYFDLYGESYAPQFEEREYNSKGQKHSVAILDKDHALCLVAKYSAKARMNMIKKIKQLERENKLLKEHMNKMVSLDEVKVYKIEAASAKAAQHRAEDNYYAIEKFMFKNMDKCGNPAELDEQYFDVKFESNRYHDSQEVVYRYQAQLEVACEKLKAKDELIANLVDKNSEILKLN